MVAGARTSNKKLATGRRVDCTQALSCNAGEHNPQRRAVRYKLTHAKTCQTIHRIPANREIAVTAAHAGDKTAVPTTIQAASKAKAKAANLAEEDAKEAAKAPANPSNAQCLSQWNSLGGKSC